MTEVDYGGGGHRTWIKINDQLVSLGVPPTPVYKGARVGVAGLGGGAPRRSPTPTGSRIPPLPSSRSRSQGKGEEKRRKEGAQPPPLVQFGLGLGGRPNSPLSFP